MPLVTQMTLAHVRLNRFARQGRQVEMTAPDLSIVIPMRNEAGNAQALLAEIDALSSLLPPYEVIAVDDGSDDETADMVAQVAADDARMRLLRHPSPAGQSAAIHSGVQAARAGLIATLDGDGQNPPGDLPDLLALLIGDETGRLGLVAGQRQRREDGWSKRIASRIANALRAALLRDGTRDSSCGIKAFRRDAFLALPYFNHMHRFLPALFKRDGWQVALVDVGHRPRLAGRSNYTNVGRALVGLVDLIGVAWLLRRRKKAAAHEITKGGRDG